MKPKKKPVALPIDSTSLITENPFIRYGARCRFCLKELESTENGSQVRHVEDKKPLEECRR